MMSWSAREPHGPPDHYCFLPFFRAHHSWPLSLQNISKYEINAASHHHARRGDKFTSDSHHIYLNMSTCQPKYTIKYLLNSNFGLIQSVLAPLGVSFARYDRLRIAACPSWNRHTQADFNLFIHLLLFLLPRGPTFRGMVVGSRRECNSQQSRTWTSD